MFCLLERLFTDSHFLARASYTSYTDRQLDCCCTDKQTDSQDRKHYIQTTTTFSEYKCAAQNNYVQQTIRFM